MPASWSGPGGNVDVHDVLTPRSHADEDYSIGGLTLVPLELHDQPALAGAAFHVTAAEAKQMQTVVEMAESVDPGVDRLMVGLSGSDLRDCLALLRRRAWRRTWSLPTLVRAVAAADYLGATGLLPTAAISEKLTAGAVHSGRRRRRQSQAALHEVMARTSFGPALWEAAPTEVVGRLIVAGGGGQDDELGRAVGSWARAELVRRLAGLPDLALAKLRGPALATPARAELLCRHPQLTPFDNGSLKVATRSLKAEYNSTRSCVATEAKYGPLPLWDTSQVTGMSELFRDCRGRPNSAFSATFTSDLSGWDVGRVESMYGMFWGASAFTSDLSGWNVGRVESMYGMFLGASAFTSDLSGWNVGRVESMFGMFASASAFTSDLSGWDVSRVESMYGMFAGASAFTSVLSGWDVGRIKRDRADGRDRADHMCYSVTSLTTGHIEHSAASAPAPAAASAAAAAKAAATAAKVSWRQSRPAGKSSSGWCAMGPGRAHVTEELQAEAEHHL